MGISKNLFKMEGIFLADQKNYESTSKVGKADNEEVQADQNFEHEERQQLGITTTCLRRLLAGEF